MSNKPRQPVILTGGSLADTRGTVEFVNTFNLDRFLRFYIITHLDTSTVRAWQGHKDETKAFFCLNGSFTIAVVEIDDWRYPSPNLKPDIFTLNDSQKVLILPGGYANGLKANERDSRLFIFSDKTLEESEQDDYRFERNLWLNWEKI